MGEFNKLVDKAGQVAGAAMKTTQNLVNKGRDKAEEMAQQAKLAKLHRQLGALVYALRKNGEENEPMLAWYVSEIDRIHARIANLRAGDDGIKVYPAPNFDDDPEDDGDAMFRGGGGDEFP